MSRTPLEDVNINETPAGDRHYPPRSAQSQAWRNESHFVDSSGPIFSMYLELAEEEDKKMAESWKADAEGILVFTGLFSAAVASLISVSIQDIQQNPQDTSNFYLGNIYQLLADPTRPNIPSSLPASPPPFSPPTHAVWVNGLWFMSLVISITCALLATLLQQWARRYLKVTQPRYSLPKRARVRSFFAEGVEKSFLPLAVEALPTMIHVSVLLFFAGLVVFLWSVNLTIFKVVLSWISVCTVLYGCITLIPIFRRDSPYYTPLTLLAWLVVVAMIGVVLIFCAGFYVLGLLFSCCCVRPFRIFGYLTNYVDEVLETTLMKPERVALMSPPEIDTRALMWTFDRLDDDHELERFFSGLPGFYDSKALKEPLHRLDDQQNLSLLTTMIGLLDRTFSSDFLPDPVKRQRTDICANALNLMDAPKAFSEIVRRLASEHGYGPVQTTEILHFFKRWGYRKGEDPTLDQALFSVVVARVQHHDDPWFMLASDELGIPEPVLRSHAAHGDSLSLAVLIYVTRQQFIHIEHPSWPLEAIANVLEAASKFDAHDTSPELQHEFCALWNQAVHQARNDSDWDITNRILRRIRNVYVSLHQDTDSAPTRFSATTGNLDAILYELSAYPVCKVAEHTLDESPLPTFASTVQHGNASASPVPRASPVAPSFPLPSPLPFHVDENLRSVPLLDNLHSTHQFIESFPVPITEPDRAMAGEIHDIVASGITASYPTPESFVSAPHFSASSPAAVSLQHLTDRDSLNLPSSASNPVLDNMLHADSHRPIILTTASSASPRRTSAPKLGNAAEDDGRPKLDLHKEMDALELLSVNRPIDANTRVTPDLPPQSASPHSVTNSEVAIASCSLRESIAEHTEHHSPEPSHYQYDIV